MDYPTAVATLMSVACLILLVARVPIAVALTLPSIVGIGLLTSNFSAGPRVVVDAFFSTLSSEVFLVIPLYVILGNIAFSTNVATDIFDAAKRWLGNFRGGLGIATGLASGGFSAVTGSSAAVAATMARTAMPELLKAGYAPRLGSAIIAAAGTVGILLPPSVVLVMYGILADQSIGRLLIAGVVPGVLSVLANCLVIAWVVRRHPQLAPGRVKYSWSAKGVAAVKILPVVMVFLAVVGGIYAGMWSPTESAAVGVIALCVLAYLKPKVRFKEASGQVWLGITDSIKLSASIMLLICGAIIFGRLLAMSGTSQRMISFAVELPVGRVGVLILMLLVLLILGTFLEGAAILALAVPFMVPAVIMLDYDPIWFGIIMVKMIEIAMITPPVGITVFVMSAVFPSVNSGTIFRGIVPFFLMECGLVALFVVFPEIVTFLPNMAFG